MKPLLLFVGLPTLLWGLTCLTVRPAPPVVTKNALPYTLDFVEKSYGATSPLPRLQAYAFTTVKSGEWLIMGGRRQGLHTFEQAPALNFVPDSANHLIYLISPTTGQYRSFDTRKLSPNLAASLQATNQQFYTDPKTGLFYLVGGYGLNAAQSNMVTMTTLLRFDPEKMAAAIRSGQGPAQITALIKQTSNDLFAVTGGELFQLDGLMCLVFGQRFDGQYRAFGSDKFTQTYTESVGQFTLNPSTLSIATSGTLTTSGPDSPLHRRDGNIIDDVDPTTGKLRLAAFGGVFKPGIIDAYTNPVYIYPQQQLVVDRSVNQRFSQYGCPVITVYDSRGKTVYHTFFGGISHYYYSQTKAQQAVYDSATAQGRNDGFPFIADISTLLQKKDGTYQEFIHPKPIPRNRLLGCSAQFIMNRTVPNQPYQPGVQIIDLARAGTNRQLIGYVYGGIEALNPLPSRPNGGTTVSNSVFEVYLTYKPTDAIPASQGHESVRKDFALRRD